MGAVHELILGALSDRASVQNDVHKLSDLEIGEVISLGAFCQSYFDAELEGSAKYCPPLSFLGSSALLKAGPRIQALLKIIIAEARKREAALFTIAQAAMQNAAALMQFESEIHDLSRCFDIFDELLAIDYHSDALMGTSRPKHAERLYAGAAARVQSSYTTLIQSLKNLKPKVNDHLIDLGSGYGRMGFVVGLMRPDMRFSGYEYIPERVGAAQKAVQQLGLHPQITFHAQNLASDDFKIPTADIYYLYDPFSATTYARVLKQLKDIAQAQSFTILCKGHAAQWVEEFFAQPPYQSFDSGNLNLFRIAHELQRSAEV